jgi:hypothetical protein
MKRINILLACVVCSILSTATFADVGFTKEDLELVKEACLAGSSFDFKTEADGSISVKNLEGKGKLSINKKNVTTVDLPDSDKKDEFNEIRSCIRSYLTESKPKKKSTAKSTFSRTCEYRSGPRAGETEYFPPEVPITPARIGQSCTDGQGSFGIAIADE